MPAGEASRTNIKLAKSFSAQVSTFLRKIRRYMYPPIKEGPGPIGSTGFGEIPHQSSPPNVPGPGNVGQFSGPGGQAPPFAPGGPRNPYPISAGMPPPSYSYPTGPGPGYPLGQVPPGSLPGPTFPQTPPGGYSGSPTLGPPLSSPPEMPTGMMPGNYPMPYSMPQQFNPALNPMFQKGMPGQLQPQGQFQPGQLGAQKPMSPQGPGQPGQYPPGQMPGQMPGQHQHQGLKPKGFKTLPMPKDKEPPKDSPQPPGQWITVDAGKGHPPAYGFVPENQISDEDTGLDATPKGHGGPGKEGQQSGISGTAKQSSGSGSGEQKGHYVNIQLPGKDSDDDPTWCWIPEIDSKYGVKDKEEKEPKPRM